MTDFIKKGDDPNTAWEKASGSYGRVKPEQGAVKIIDPRKEQSEIEERRTRQWHYLNHMKEEQTR